MLVFFWSAGLISTFSREAAYFSQARHATMFVKSVALNNNLHFNSQLSVR